jgi:hypothetical protein
VSHTHNASVTDPGHGHNLQTITRTVFDFTGGSSGYGQDTPSGVGPNVAISNNITNISVTISSTGSSGTNQNLPPYYALAYIMNTTVPANQGNIDLSAYALKNSPTFTGTPSAPTASFGTSSNQLATTAFVQNAVGGLDFAPINSPLFTGTPRSTTPTPATDSSNRIATTQFVQSAISTAFTNNIVFKNQQGVNSSTITLPGGTWLVSCWAVSHQAAFAAQTLVIDGRTIYTAPNNGDPPGTSYRPMFGCLVVSGGRDVTCAVTGVANEYSSTDSRQFMIIAHRYG